MDGFRTRLPELDLPHHDCLITALMDYIATWTEKKNGTFAPKRLEPPTTSLSLSPESSQGTVQCTV
jgi:hypothetical protein